MAKTDIFLDIETYSTVDLRKTNAYRYVEDPHFRILMMSYAIGWDGPVRNSTDPEEIYRLIYEITASDNVRIWAHNASFERICFSREMGLDVWNGEYLPVEIFEDTQALAAEWGHPQQLELLARAMNGELKDAAGQRLISLFCKPDRKGHQVLPHERPQEWQAFIDYCDQDVEALRDIAKRLRDWPTEQERRLWELDQKINDYGIAVDMDMARAAVEAGDNNRIEQELEITGLTGIWNPNSTQQLKAWFEEDGMDVPNFKAETVQSMLDHNDLNPTRRRVLELRQELAMTASSKYTAALDRVNRDNRLRGSFHFYGAHTGRWAGRGVQLQNLPRASLDVVDEDGDVIPDPSTWQINTTISSAVLDLKMTGESDAHTLKALIRPMFTGPFAVVDYAAIEARVLAWLAGETWALEAFEAGRDIYVETAERMGGLTRSEGKVAVLALGYNGGIGSLRSMGAEGDDEKLRMYVDQWRMANRKIVDFWDVLDRCFRQGDTQVGEHLYIERGSNSERRIILPSGRGISYHQVGSKWGTTPWGTPVQQLSFVDPKKFPWRMDTYGGRLAENVTQGVARDVLASALLRLHDSGYRVVGHIHDEVIVEIKEESEVEVVTRIVEETDPWMKGLPINAEGFYTPRYRKD